MNYFSQAALPWQGWFSGNESTTIDALNITSFKALNTAGITDPIFQYSVGGKAVCVSGVVQVPLSASAINITYPGPKNNFELTELITDLFRVNSDAWVRYLGEKVTVTETFQIQSKLCIPKETEQSTFTAIQFLTHGGTLDSTYWEFTSNYSYIDAAAEKGYATFSYDRLGSGKSQHPNPLQIVQSPLQVDIAHELIQKLKAGSIGGIRFETVVGIGHSLGGALTQSLSSRFPDDVDALILTGHAGFRGGMAPAFAAAAWQIANTLPDRPAFRGLSTGYMAHSPVPQAMQFGFFYYPYFEPAIFYKEIQTRGTTAIGEIMTLSDLYAPVPAFTRPVFILNGKQDFFYCQGDCDAEGGMTAMALTTFYPNAATSSQATTLPNIGHNINFHTGREEAFDEMLNFIEGVGIRP